MTFSHMTNRGKDAWYDWLLHRRYGGGTVAYKGRFLKIVEDMRHRVLDGAQLSERMHLLDVGTGDGLIAFAGIERVGPALQVTFSDVSEPLLEHCKQAASAKHVFAQCRFLHAEASDLSQVDSASVDAVTTRSVLAYVADKPKAFAEFYRVLKPGRRISIAEPIMQEIALETCALAKMIEAQPAAADTQSQRLLLRLRAAIYPSTPEAIRASPITNFNERDLILMARTAGFVELHLELHIDMRVDFGMSWDVFLDTSSHPGAPTPREVMDQLFTDKERNAFEHMMRPQIEVGESLAVSHMAYLTAQKLVNRV